VKHHIYQKHVKWKIYNNHHSDDKLVPEFFYAKLSMCYHVTGFKNLAMDNTLMPLMILMILK
jgi:hypothetical protein